MVKKNNTSIHSNKFHESKRDKDKSRRHDSNSKSSMSFTDQSIAIPNVQLHSLQSTIESTSPSFFLLTSSLFNANPDIQDHLLDKKECHVSPKRIDQKSAPCFSFDMDSSLYVNDELEISANKLKDKTKVDQHSKGKRKSKIISNNSGARKECLND